MGSVFEVIMCIRQINFIPKWCLRSITAQVLVYSGQLSESHYSTRHRSDKLQDCAVDWLSFENRMNDVRYCFWDESVFRYILGSDDCNKYLSAHTHTYSRRIVFGNSKRDPFGRLCWKKWDKTNRKHRLDSIVILALSRSRKTQITSGFIASLLRGCRQGKKRTFNINANGVR